MEDAEEFLKRLRRTCNVVISCGLVLMGLKGPPLLGQEASRSPLSKRALNASAHAEIWKSETTGKEYRVRVEKDRFYAEWVPGPGAPAQRGAYIRTECRRVGSKWIGTSRSFLPCEVDEKKVHTSNWCHLTTRTEIDTLTPDRIVGRGESLRRFDCATCKILEAAMSEFVWVPKR